MELNNNIYNRKWFGPLILTIIWFIFGAIVNPIGDFPVNDDWAYALNVHSLSEENNLTFSGWPAMTLITQTLIGAGVCKIFGFSFTVLRLSTLVLALLTMIITHRLVLKITSNFLLSLLAGLLFLFNPIFLSLSMTFMTEIYYIFFCITSIWFAYQYFSTDKWQHFLLLLLSLSLLLLVRQTGIVWFIALTIVLCLRSKSILDLIKAGAPIILAFLLLRFYMSFRASHPDGLGTYSDSSILTSSLSNINLQYLIERFSSILYYLGIFLAPLAITTFPALFRNISWQRSILYSLSFILPMIMISQWDVFPNGNIINQNGLGVYLLKDLFFNVNSDPLISANIFVVLRIVSLLSILLLSIFAMNLIRFTPLSIQKIRAYFLNPNQAFKGLLIISSGGILLHLFLNPVFFDRYTLELSIVLGILLLTLVNPSKLVYMASASCGFLYFIGSTCSIHDYMNWNRAKQMAINYAQDSGGNPRTIDGGLEYGGWHGSSFGGNTKNIDLPMTWVIEHDEFVISAGFIEDYKLIKTIPVNTLFTTNRDVCVLQKSRNSEGADNRKYPIHCDFDIMSSDGQFVLDNNGFALVKTKKLISTAEYKSGKQSLKLDAKSKDLPGIFVRDLKFGERIEASVWLKGSMNAHLVIQTVGDFSVYKLSQNSGAISNWTKVNLTVDVTENIQGKDLKVFLWNPSDSTAWFDDYRVNRLFLLPSQ